MLSVHWLHFKSVCYARDITGAICPVCNYYVQIIQLLKRPSHNYTRPGHYIVSHWLTNGGELPTCGTC